eukprot:gene13985-15444_t
MHFLRIFSAILFIIIIYKGEAQNLLANPGAESGNTGWGLVNDDKDGWQVTTYSPYANSGSRYFLTTCTSNCQDLTQTISSLSVGSGYLLSFVTEGSGGTLSVKMSTLTLLSSFSVPSSYNTYSSSFIATSGSMTLTFIGSTHVRVDDVSLVFVSASPTRMPTRIPSNVPTVIPTRSPTVRPTMLPTRNPSATPSTSPSRCPTRSPSTSPTFIVTANPSRIPTRQPTNPPTVKPTTQPSFLPSLTPSRVPSAGPTAVPSTSGPSAVPS